MAEGTDPNTEAEVQGCLLSAGDGSDCASSRNGVINEQKGERQRNTQETSIMIQFGLREHLLLIRTSVEWKLIGHG